MGASSAALLGLLLGMQVPPATVDLQLSDDLLAFRVVVTSTSPVTFDADQLRPPVKGLSPARVGAVGLRGDGSVFACGLEGRPAFPYAMVSGSNAAPGGAEWLLRPGEPFATEWHETTVLLGVLDRCGSAQNPPEYERFKIVVELDTEVGPLRFETVWMPVPAQGG